MQTSNAALSKFIASHLDAHPQAAPQEKTLPDFAVPVITLSMEPGSQGCQVAAEVATRMGLDLYNRDIIKALARSMKTSTERIDNIEKERLHGIEDFIASLIEEKYLHNDIYMEHLVKVVGLIADRGNAIIVGRGANFILPPEKRFAARLIAPSKIRVANIVSAFNAPEEEARRRVTRREARRRAFIRQSFNKDIRNPSHYDLTLNMARMSVTAAAEAIIVSARSSREASVQAGNAVSGI